MPLQPPYGVIANYFKEGSIIPFLGAGVNFGTRDPPDAKWDEKSSAFLPSGAELSRILAGYSSFPSQERQDVDDLAKVSAYYVEIAARKGLTDQLHKFFNRDFVPCEIHKYLAEVSRPLLIVTTNYDDLTERAFTAAGREYDLVVHAIDSSEVAGSVLWWKAGEEEPVPILPSKLSIDLTKTTVIYKMHGTVDRKSKWDNYVITEDDYVDFLSRMADRTAVPALFMKAFHERHFLFLGYGLRDWNLRLVLRNLRGVLPDVSRDVSAGATGERTGTDREQSRAPSYAIQFRPSDLEVELWKGRNVKIFDVDINEFVRRLRLESSLL